MEAGRDLRSRSTTSSAYPPSSRRDTKLLPLRRDGERLRINGWRLAIIDNHGRVQRHRPSDSPRSDLDVLGDDLDADAVPPEEHRAHHRRARSDERVED